VGGHRPGYVPVSSLRKREHVAELTNLEAKLADVLGLAMAAQGATDRVNGMLADDGDSRLGSRGRA